MCSICFLESPCKILALQVLEDALPLDLWCEEVLGGVKTGSRILGHEGMHTAGCFGVKWAKTILPYFLSILPPPS